MRGRSETVAPAFRTGDCNAVGLTQAPAHWLAAHFFRLFGLSERNLRAWQLHANEPCGVRSADPVEGA